MKTYKEFNEKISESLIYYFKGFIYSESSKDVNIFKNNIVKYINILNELDIKYIFCYDNVNKFIIYCSPITNQQYEFIKEFSFNISRYQSFKSFFEFEKYITNTLHHKIITPDNILNILKINF